MDRIAPTRTSKTTISFVGGLAAFLAFLLIGLGYGNGRTAATSQDDIRPEQVQIEVLLDDPWGHKPAEPGATVRVAILSNESFDATSIDPASITIEGVTVVRRRNGKARASIQDVNGDHLMDLVVWVHAEGLQITIEPKKIAMQGETLDGTLVEGVGCVQSSGMSCGEELLSTPGGKRRSAKARKKSIGIAGVPSATIVSAGATLVAESCTPANGAIDPNEMMTVSFCVQNTGTDTTNLVGTLQATGGVTSPSGPQNYGAVMGGGATIVCRNFTFFATGTCGGTITATIQFQDGATNLGTVDYIFMLGAPVTTSFSNATTIIVPATGTGDAATPSPANPYPSTITVAGIVDPIAKVTVSLNNITDTFPDDWDVLLVGPGGQNLLLMSDTGLGDDITGVTLTFDDAAASSLPDGGPLVTGTFKPTNFGTGDTFVAPAPAGPYPDPQLLSIFNGTTANGVWSLYVVDDAAVDIGQITGGWTLNIITAVCSTTCPPPSGCMITCPANVTVSNDPNQCGAVVTYPAPTTSGACGTVTCSPASGSFFPVGTTTVTCTASPTPSCTFTVTVNDTQPPSITCPPNVTVVGSGSGAVITFPPPTASDNCPGLTTACTPPSGSTLPVGTTTVTCTATDASGNTATCSFTVTVFDICLQDSSNPTKVLLINSTTGEYRFCCGGTIFTGTGTIGKKGTTVTLDHVAPDRRVVGKSLGGGKGSGSLQFPPGTTICTITDNTAGNGTCACP